MNTSVSVSRHATTGRSMIVVAALVLGFAFNSISAAPQAMADANAPLPVTVSFDKATGEDGPYIMTVTNTSSEALTIKVAVFQSVQSHNQPKDFELPEETLAAGKSTTVKELAAHDKVKISAKGYAAKELVVPGKK